jgi:hypothetical protein
VQPYHPEAGGVTRKLTRRRGDGEKQQYPLRFEHE